MNVARVFIPVNAGQMAIEVEVELVIDDDMVTASRTRTRPVGFAWGVWVDLDLVEQPELAATMEPWAAVR